MNDGIVFLIVVGKLLCCNGYVDLGHGGILNTLGQRLCNLRYLCSITDSISFLWFGIFVDFDGLKGGSSKGERR